MTRHADDIIAGTQELPEGDDLKAVIKDLKKRLEFGKARKILSKISGTARTVWVIQQQALCTYKDEELMASWRYERALELLRSIGLGNAGQQDAETLALGGAVYKRRWEVSGQLEDLQQSLAFYSAAWDRNPTQDVGYGGVNAVYVLDILGTRAALLAKRAGIDPERAPTAVQFRARAQELRQEMLKQLPVIIAQQDAQWRNKGGTGSPPSEQYWYLVTLAEIEFGLRNYSSAAQWLDRARATGASDWELQTTFKQLVSLARLQGVEAPEEGSQRITWHEAWQALVALLGDRTEPALSCWRGKVGLALSGGGFRASLFHLGVLARLAEMDVLRSVEVLSTVSGGSIVGAHYYLEVRNLLQSKKDEDITREDFILIVRRLQDQFLAGVQRNLRVRALSNLPANLRFALGKHYTRSHRMGELYERELYSRVGDGHSSEEPRAMRNFLISPPDQPPHDPFKPRFHNWRRRAKVPTLLLNTTSLNSGHSWHFTARWMGEPPGLLDPVVDANARYRRLWYDQAPHHLRDFRMGHAVAASACVPGLFEPLVIEDLYPGRTVRLVDGGVHDNQGVEGLLNEGCTLIFCSDASGQMEDLERPPDGNVGVPLRANGILMDRVREAEYQDLRARVESRSLEGLFFIHLKKELDVAPLDWMDCDDPSIAPAQSIGTTSYGVDKDLQRRLAAIRTDLDSFTEVEAYALMASGYLMAEREAVDLNAARQRDEEPGEWGGFRTDAPRGAWPFLELESLMRLAPDSSDVRRRELGRQLGVGSELFFKIWRLNATLRTVAALLGAGALVMLGVIFHAYWTDEITPPTLVVGPTVLVLLLAILVMLFPLLEWLQPQKAVSKRLRRVLYAVIAFALMNLHLLTFDRLFLRQGRLRRLMRLR